MLTTVEEVTLAVGRLDLLRGVLHREEKHVTLTSREVELMRYLVSNPSRIIARDELLTSVWGYSDTVLSRACDNLISRLRTKIEADPAAPAQLLTVFGAGYRFEPFERPAEVVQPAVPVSTPAQSEADSEPPILLGDGLVDLSRLRFTNAATTTTLTTNEVDLLRRLHRARGAVVDRATLLREIWGPATGTRAVDNAIARLRAKIEPDPTQPRYLLTHRGGGYSLDVPQPARPAAREVLVGRVQDCRALAAALAASRWVLVTGTGGIGKTKIVRHVVGDRSNVVWVDLAQADTAWDVRGSLARALGVELTGDDPDQITRVLARRGAALLVLDNLEQIADEVAPLVRTWLEAAPQLSLVGTSRVRLGLDEERVVELPPLSVEDAAALFVQRVRAACPSLVLTPRHDPLIESLVTRLDGLPLAIELAAARVPALGIEGLLARLDRQLDLLARPRADNPRHRSLREVIATSWELLESEERSALLLWSRFREGFSPEDAEGTLGLSAIDSLQTLRDHHLVYSKPGERFAVFESIRAFADEQRAQLPDGGCASDLCWVRWMARLGEPKRLRVLLLRGQGEALAQQIQAADALERAADIALQWREGELAARCLFGAAPVRFHYGPYSALLARIERTLDEASVSDSTRARLQIRRGELYNCLNRPDEAVSAAEACIALSSPDDSESLADAYALLGYQMPETRQRLDPNEAYDRAAALFDAMGQRHRGAWYRARAQMRRKNIDSLRLLDDALTLSRQVGDGLVASNALFMLGQFDQANQRPGLARQRYLEAIEGFRELSLPTPEISASNNLLSLMMYTGDREGFDEIGARTLELTDRLGDRLFEVTCHGYIACAHIVARSFHQARSAAAEARRVMSLCRPVPRTLAHLELYEADMMLALSDLHSALQLATHARHLYDELDGMEHMVARADGMLARIYVGLGDNDQAMVHAERAVVGDTDESDIHRWICRAQYALVCAQTGEHAIALRELAAVARFAATSGFAGPRSVLGAELARAHAALASEETALTG